MRTRRLVVVTLLAFAGFGGPALAVPKRQSAVETIRAFYSRYLALLKTQGSPSLRPAFSKAFVRDSRANAAACRKFARKDDPCGWDADSDPFLDAQDFERELNPRNTRLSVREAATGEVDVRLHVLPRQAPERERHIRYLMVWERGRWVVDDILPEGKAELAARKRMKKEIARLRAAR